MTDAVKLAACPFCKSSTHVRLTNVFASAQKNARAVTCDVCLCCGPVFTDPDQAIAAWNQRTLAASPVGWQSIDTAPKELDAGREIERRFILILHDPDVEHTYRVQTGFWNELLNEWQPCDDTSPAINPIEWQPLPPAPSPDPQVSDRAE